MFTHLSLFSGIGGLDLAAEWAGFCTVGQCEISDYAFKVLEKHWPEVPRWRDIKTLTKESFYGRTGLRTVDVISGGFPCQPFSISGKRRGKADDRYLWPDMLRVIEELRPSWVVGENVANIAGMVLDDVLIDLEALGYSCRSFIVPACGVSAPHRRYRAAILAYSNCYGCEPSRFISSEGCHSKSFYPSLSESSYVNSDCWSVEPGVGRVVNGVPFGMDRIRCLGNAVVPQQFYPFFKAIMNYELSLF